MKQVLASFIIILIAAAAIFLIGWVQFDIKPGECGVMVSKTSGTHEKALLPGSFAWRWEKLLPTNTNIHKFSMEPHTSVQSYTGSLPGSDLYSKMLESSPDFSYELEIAVQLSPKAEGLVSLVEKNEISSQEDLDAYLENKARVLSKAVADSILPDLDAAPSRSYYHPKALDKSSLETLAKSAADDLETVTLNSIEITKSRLPDMESYANTKELYENYKLEIEESLKERAAQYADEIHEGEKSITMLEKYAELLKKYPQLKDLGTINEVTKTLNGLSSNEGIGEKLDSLLEGKDAAATGAESASAPASTESASVQPSN